MYDWEMRSLLLVFTGPSSSNAPTFISINSFGWSRRTCSQRWHQLFPWHQRFRPQMQQQQLEAVEGSRGRFLRHIQHLRSWYRSRRWRRKRGQYLKKRIIVRNMMSNTGNTQGRVPGIQPRIVKQMLIKNEQVQQPRCKQTAMGGRKIAQKTLQQSINVIAILVYVCLCLWLVQNLGHRLLGVISIYGSWAKL